MDQGYLEWLIGLPMLGEAKARSVAARFATFEHLRAASRDELLEVRELTLENADALFEAVHGDAAADGIRLFLCPACGSFVGASAAACPVCGATFAEEDADLPDAPASPPEPAPEVQPERGYLEWLEGLPALGAAKSRRIAARFPSFDALRAASREDILSVEGLTPEDLDSLRTLVEPERRDEPSGLALCPACGSFLGAEIGSCPVCGAEISKEQRAAAPAALPAEGAAGALPLLCLHCGAFMSPKQARCGMCGRDRTPGDIVPLPGVDLPDEAQVPLCPHCGAYRYAESEDCIICGRPFEAPKASEANAQAKGVGRGFLTRWKRITESEPLTEEDRLKEQLEHFERLIEAEPLLEVAWAKRARVLAGLGRPKEAAESLARAAELNPSKDEAYRIEVLNLLKPSGDVPVLPPRWRQVEATAGPARASERLLETLRRYEDLLRADPSLANAWRAKAEILAKMGRHAEAKESVRRAIDVEHWEDRVQRIGLDGLQTRGAARAPTRGPKEGRVNGRINGLVNGRVNGLTNGRVNGLTNGRVNGFMAGGGATNGLVNGDGFTNGRPGRYGHVRAPPQPHWARSLVGVAAVLSLLVFVPLLASLILPAPGTSELIRIDHDFGDWAAFPAYADSPNDQLSNPDVNLLATKVAATADDFFVYARFGGQPFRGGGTNGSDSLFVFVDEDADSSTGYPIGDLGADALAEVYGWDGAVRGAVRRVFNGTGSSDDWNRFVPRGTAEADASGQEVELRLSAERGTRASRVLVYAADNRGNRDAADGSVRPALTTLIVEQTTVAPPVVVAGPVSILRVALVPLGGSAYVTALNVSQEGSSNDLVSLSLYVDDGNAIRDASDVRVSTAPVVARRAILGLGRVVSSPVVLWVDATWAAVTPASTFGIRVADLWTNGSTSLRPAEFALAYLGSAPPTITVDGAFADWSGRLYGQDLLGDVVNRTGQLMYNANVDLLATAVDVGANFTAFARVDGRILGGEDIPTLRTRSPAFVPTDTDGDTVPDIVEFGLPNPELAYDFDNDNVTDNRTGGDADSDGVLDYPGGPDTWLNATIPPWYPAPYGGKSVSRYIGPITTEPVAGLDVLYAYGDADNRTDTGLGSVVAGRSYGFDFAVAVLGRNGGIRFAGLYVYAAGGTPWTYRGPVEAAIDAHRIEFATNATVLGLASDFRIVFYASDWRLEYDEADPLTNAASFVVEARAATTVVINEVSPAPNPEWVELANPTGAAVSLAGWDIVRVNGNRIVVLYTFTTQVLGAWGSGSEYLAVSLASNSLPNGNVRVRLRQAGTTIDETTYSAAVAGGQSWSRLKDPMTGVPLDTGIDAADFYISLAPSRGQGNDRHRPTILVAKTSSTTTASPGDLITYTIYYNNTNTGLSKTVWVNDTFPAGLTFVSSSVAPTTVTGTTYGWVFVNVLPSSTNSFTVTVQVNANAADQQPQANEVTLDYTDQLQRRLPRSRAWANVTVVRPAITIQKTVSPATAQVGDTVTFTIYYNNTGSVAAGTVSIKDVLPAGLDYVGSSPAPTWTDGRTSYWNFTNVAVGSHSITVTATVNALANGTLLVNWAFLNYTTLGGYPLGSSSASTVLAVPELQDVALVLVPLVVLVLCRHMPRRKRGSG